MPANPATSKGNSFYLGSTDQRGAVKADSVSIGAYQWVRPTGISIFPQQITLCPGDSAGMVVTVSPALVSESGYTLTSLYDSVAHVNGSEIHAGSLGFNEIVVRTVDGGLKDTCSVVVIGPCQASVANETVLPGQNRCYSATQTITVAGNNTTFTVLNGGSATLVAGQKISLLPGTTVASGGYLWAYISPGGPFCVTPSFPTVLKDQMEPQQPMVSEKSTIRIYPNPTPDKFTIELSGEPEKASVILKIINMMGSQIGESTIQSGRLHEFSLIGQRPGVYLIKVMQNNEIIMFKVIKQ